MKMDVPEVPELTEAVVWVIGIVCLVEQWSCHHPWRGLHDDCPSLDRKNATNQSMTYVM